MATETLYATSHITGTFSNPNNAVGSETLNWAGDLNLNTNYTSRWAIGDPVNPLTSGFTTHTVTVQARKGTNTGTPTIQLNLYENGTLVKALTAAVNVTSLTGQLISGTFSTSEITNRNNIEVEVVQVSAGGSPTARNSAQINYIQLDADTTSSTPATVTPGVIAAVVAAPSSTRLFGAQPLPAAVAAVAAAPVAAAQSSATKAPAVVTATTTTPAATPSGPTSQAPAVIAATTTLPAPGVTATAENVILTSTMRMGAPT